MAKISYTGAAVVGWDGLGVLVLWAAPSELRTRAADEAGATERAGEPGIFGKPDKTRRKTSDETAFAIIRAPFGA
jgi:hypothetical protein